MTSFSKLDELARVAERMRGDGNPDPPNVTGGFLATQQDLTAGSSLVHSADLTADHFFFDEHSFSTRAGADQSLDSSEGLMSQDVRARHTIKAPIDQKRTSSVGLGGAEKAIDKKQCQICFRHFREASAVRKHVAAVHHKTRNFGCSVCGQRFAESSNLKKHELALHRDERPHECGECGKRFHFTDGLRRHIRNCHLGLRPFKCEMCGFRFKQGAHLKKHQSAASCKKTLSSGKGNTFIDDHGLSACKANTCDKLKSFFASS